MIQWGWADEAVIWKFLLCVMTSERCSNLMTLKFQSAVGYRLLLLAIWVSECLKLLQPVLLRKHAFMCVGWRMRKFSELLWFVFPHMITVFNLRVSFHFFLSFSKKKLMKQQYMPGVVILMGGIATIFFFVLCSTCLDFSLSLEDRTELLNI